MSIFAFTIGATQTEPLPPLTGGFRAVAGILVVLGIVCVLAWLARRGTLRFPGSRARLPMSIDAALPLGERRSLVVVSVEGRRLLLGLTPAHVSFVTELAAAPPASAFQDAVDRRLVPPTPAS